MRSTAAWRSCSNGCGLYETDGGADWVQFESPHSIAEIKRARTVVKGPFSAMKGQLPRALTLAEHRALGLNAAWYTFLPDQVLKVSAWSFFQEFKKKDMSAWDEFVLSHPDTPFTGGAKSPLGCDRNDRTEQIGSEVCAQAQAEIVNMDRLLLFLLFIIVHTSAAQAQSDFFKGKQMKIVVGASAGAASDLYARVVANYLPKHITGKPEIIVQNMPGGGSLTAANYVYSVAKPDGLTLGAVTAPIYFAQLLGRKEVQFDWAKFTWIGTPEENDELFFLRSDQPYKTLLDLRKATDPPRCGASGVGSTGYYIPKLLEEVFAVKINDGYGLSGSGRCRSCGGKE